MRTILRRGLFWRVYLTVLASLVLVAILGGVVGHMLMDAAMRADVPSGLRRAPAAFHVLVFLLLVAGAVGLAAYPVVSRITRRLEALRRSVEAWGAGALTHRASTQGGDEIAAVAASFNAAADRAEALLAAHKTLLAHASHELRSPLARLRLAAEMFVASGDAKLLPTITGDIAEIDGLVDEILLASRLDHDVESADRERVDCLALAAEEVARAGVGLRPVDDASPGFEVLGSARLLRRMIRNLIENALKHGGPPTEVELRHEFTGGRPVIVIAVHDHGHGIPADLREQVFEPFFRPAGRSEEAGSWGLGLSLVRQIAKRHGGAACTSSAHGVTSFIVEVPGID